MNRTSRRALLAGTGATLATAALVASPALAATPAPDAALLALVGEFHAALAEFQAVPDDAPDAMGDKPYARYWAAFDAIAAAPPAATEAGRSGKASVLLAITERHLYPCENNRLEPDWEFARRFMAEVAAAGGIMPTVPVRLVAAGVPYAPTESGIAIGHGGQDYAVLQAAREVLRLETELAERASAPEADRDILHAHQSEAMRRLAVLPARSLAGLRAKGTVLAVYCEGNPLEDGTPCGAVIASLLDDLTGQGVAI
jgi:hypothetical protein